MKKNKTYSRLSLFIRSLIFSTYSITTMIIYSFLCLIGFLFPLRYRYFLICSYMKLYFRVLKAVCRIDYKIEGLENISKDRNGIILSKHQSTWETFYLPLIFYEPAIIVKYELLWIPFFGWGLATTNPISINRAQKSSAMQQVFEKGKKCLEEGRFVLVFPEGTRIPAGKVGHYKLGGARLASHTGYPVIPVAHNAGRFWPRRSFLKYPGTVRMVIGPLIESKNRTPEEILELAKNWIETTVKKIDEEEGFI